MIIERHVQAAMRDGVVLSADVYRPDSGDRFPTVLVRTCYTKAVGPFAERSIFWTKKGYAYVVQDVRGRGDSDGRFVPLAHEIEDGSDSIDWIVSQPWSDGHVVMTGGSYLGWTQLYAACSGNRHLAALIPMAAPADPDRGFPLSHGMIIPAGACWLATLDGHINQVLTPSEMEISTNHKPLIEFDRVIGRRLAPWRDWVNNVLVSEFWERLSFQQRLLRSSHPMLHVSGWYDDCLNGALENFSALSSRRSGSHGAQRLLIGPWLHATIGQRINGGIDFGEEAQVDIEDLQDSWFRECLEKREKGSSSVQVFVMGRNLWIQEESWPIPGTEYIPYYLHSAGHANSALGDGSLSTLQPGIEPHDAYQYDPSNPIPYSANFDWKQLGGPDDYRDLEHREDMLVYTSEPLESPLLICGPLTVRLFAATTAIDTDWMARILDVHPDGRAIRLNDGAVRARFRKGRHTQVFLVPGSVEEYSIDCWATCIELPVGHRLRLEISSSAQGRYDLNLNSGEPVGKQLTPKIANQTIYHNHVYPSHLVLPILRSARFSSRKNV